MNEKQVLIDSLIDNCNIPQNQLWQAKELLSVATEEQLIELTRLLAEDPQAGLELIELTLRKVKALAAQNLEAWSGILEEEKAILLAA